MLNTIPYYPDTSNTSFIFLCLIPTFITVSSFGQLHLKISYITSTSCEQVLSVLFTTSPITDMFPATSSWTVFLVCLQCTVTVFFNSLRRGLSNYFYPLNEHFPKIRFQAFNIYQAKKKNCNFELGLLNWQIPNLFNTHPQLLPLITRSHYQHNLASNRRYIFLRLFSVTFDFLQQDQLSFIVVVY